MDNFYAYIPLILKYIVILPYFLKDSKQVLRTIAIPPITRLIINNGGWIRLIATTPKGIINQLIIHIPISF
ncbi:hypothetical protein SHM_09340 [Spiroplasma ixodetis]|uniref:Uncharacterized protein n=1 Tax=Spiroplasma ixodetis TaxID=2141 RepID=A0ABM8BTX6_9MOLU|nr:hypothetical protein SHM_09340 [Spiroplasma ixodetis]